MYNQVSIQGAIVIAMDMLRTRLSSAHVDSLVLALRQHRVSDVSIFRVSKTACELIHGHPLVGGPYALLQGRPTDSDIYLVTGSGPTHLSKISGANIRYALIAELSDTGMLWDNLDLYPTFPNEYARLDQAFAQVEGNLPEYFARVLEPFLDRANNLTRSPTVGARAKIPITHGLTIDIDLSRFKADQIDRIIETATAVTVEE